MTTVMADPFAEAVEEFLGHLLEFRQYSPHTVRGYHRDLAHFGAWLCEKFGRSPDPAEVTREMVIAHVATMDCGGYGKRRRLACIGSLFAYLVLLRKVGQSPVQGIPLPKKAKPLPRALALGDVDKLLGAAKTFLDRCTVTLLVQTGIRRGEFCGVRLSDLDLEGRTIRVRGKGNKERIIPLSEDVVRTLIDWLRVRPAHALTDHLFISQAGSGYSLNTLYARVQRLGKRAKVACKVSPHRLRHSFATELIRNNVNIRIVQELLGHADLSTTGQYLAIDTAQKVDAVATLNGIGRAPDVRPLNPGSAWAYEGTATA